MEQYTNIVSVLPEPMCKKLCLRALILLIIIIVSSSCLVVTFIIISYLDYISQFKFNSTMCYVTFFVEIPIYQPCTFEISMLRVFSMLCQIIISGFVIIFAFAMCYFSWKLQRKYGDRVS